jgi:uncharacterized protein YvpB
MGKLLVGVERRMRTRYWLGLVLLSFPLFSTQLADAAPVSSFLNVPFLTQMGSAGDPNSGSNNCGPASVAMTINFYGGAISVSNAAIAIRGSNKISGNTTTDFMADTSTGNNTVNLVAQYSLNEAPVNNYSDLQNQIAAGHPVIILVNNNKYRYNSPPPYSSNDIKWFTTDHIVVVTGYNSNSVYINDPLRSTGAYPIPVSVFQSAASTTGSYGPSWHAAAIQRSAPTGVTVNFALSLSGIGTNTSGGENNNPRNPLKSAVVQLRDSSDKTIQTKNTTVSYSKTTGLFSGSVSFSSLQSGFYIIAVKLPNTLNKEARNWFQPGGTINEPTLLPLSGDIDGNNVINILDYNDLIACYGSRFASCPFKQTADLNDDGQVDGIDYNILIRAMSGTH